MSVEKMANKLKKMMFLKLKKNYVLCGNAKKDKK